MPSSAKEDQEQRETPRIEESDVMTIEFLRARLLSERAVSKSARQRADELAKRVSELEEQLKIVSLQRKKAEKAAADILGILESSGITDVSEECYSHSDQDETPHDFNSSNGSVMNRESSSSKRAVVINESDMHSGSEVESCPSTGRSLSWKSSKDPQLSLEKKRHMDSVRRRASCESYGSSGRRAGKSCRRIKHRPIEELQSEVEKETSWKEISGCDNESVPIENGNNEQYHENMESALQRQAQLIGRYEEEEKAQREWEEKFRENNGGTQDSYDHGNHSDVTEERYEMHSPKLSSPAVIDKDPSEARGIENPASNGGNLPDPRQGKAITVESSASEFSFPTSEERTEQEPPRKQPGEFGNNRRQPSLPVNASSAGHEGERETSHRNLSTSNDLGSVLDALQRAKLSLTQQMNRSATAVDKAGLLPIASPGLFRLPDDYQLLETSRTNRPEIPGIRFFPTPPFQPRNGNHGNLFLSDAAAYRPFERSPSFPASPMNQPGFITEPSSSNGTNFLSSYTSPVHPSVREVYPFLPNAMLRGPFSNGATSTRSFPASDVRPNTYR